MTQTWFEANEWEKGWHGDCSNSYNEETKQYTYAHYMRLDSYLINWYGRLSWDFTGKRLLDVGGGPASILLKCKADYRAVVDPCSYPAWVSARYAACGIVLHEIKAEEISNHLSGSEPFDIALIYNCLQHVEDPEAIIKGVRSVSREIRIFEWVEAGVTDGHIHNLTEVDLNRWLGGKGRVSYVDQYPVVGSAYYGLFKGDHFTNG